MKNNLCVITFSFRSAYVQRPAISLDAGKVGEQIGAVLEEC